MSVLDPHHKHNPKVEQPDGTILIEGGPSSFGWSGVETFTRCERMYQLRQGNKLVVTEGPLARGTLGHVALAHYYQHQQFRQTGKIDSRYPDAISALKAYSKKYGMDSDAEAAALVGVANHMQNPQPHTVVAVEEEHVGHFFDAAGKEYRVSSALDLVLQDGLGNVWIEDHKFVASSTGIPDRYTLSGQFLIQQLLGRAKWKRRFGGVIIGMNVCSPKGETKHIPLDPAPGALASFKEFWIEVQRRIEECKKRGYYLPAYNEQICRGPYGLCDFFNYCQWG